MVHAFSFSQGRCRYRNRWIRTEKFLAEREAGEALFGGLSDLLNDDPRAQGVPFNAANTHLVSHAGRFLALFEGGPPTRIDPTTLETMGVHTFDDALVGTRTDASSPTSAASTASRCSPTPTATRASPPHLTRWTLELEGGTVKEERLDDLASEFPRIDDRRACGPYRFGIAAAYAEARRDLGLFDAVVRYDHLRGTRSACRLPGYLSEPVFVPRAADAPEGEGFVLTLLWRPGVDRSEVAILDAENLGDGPLATVKLPHRVPHGFHASYLDGVTLR